MGITVLFSALVVPSASAATVSGSILDDAGRPLANARVTIQTIPMPLPPAQIGAAAGQFTPFYREVATAANGSFAVDSVPAGLVQVCPSLLSTGYIDPCLWKPRVNAFMLAASDRKSLTGLRAERGHSLSVTVSDPGGVWAERATAKATTASAAVLVGVESPLFGFQPMSLNSTAGANRYEMLVPADMPVIVSARSSIFTFDAADGSIPQRKQAGVVAFKVETPRGSAKNIALRIARKVR